MKWWKCGIIQADSAQHSQLNSQLQSHSSPCSWNTRGCKVHPEAPECWILGAAEQGILILGFGGFYWIWIHFELSFKRVDFFFLCMEFSAFSFFRRRQFCTVRLTVGCCQWGTIPAPALPLECWILLWVCNSAAATDPSAADKFHAHFIFLKFLAFLHPELCRWTITDFWE